MIRRSRIALAAAALCMALCSGQALAAKAVCVEADIADHVQHLEAQHFREDVCRCTGDQVMLRVTPGVRKNVGTISTGDGIQILDTYDVWAKVLVVSRAPANLKTKCGRIGWIGMEYIECGCEATASEAETME
ncbi:MAG: hypothetical protein IKK34_02365 [Clostridia bacterium]|nr:hypothetical protein [Clostridia bacterium]